MTEQEIKTLIDKYLAGTATEHEARLVEDFLDSYQHKTHRPGSVMFTDGGRKSEELFKKIQTRIEPGRHRRMDSSVLLKIAASVAMLLIAGLIFFISYPDEDGVEMITKSTLKGQKSNIVLSDGTHVKLNSASAITFPEQFADGSREVVLTGEAFFEVVRNESKPFIVRSGNLKTTVLGTSFNISAFEDQNINVTVATGKVKVETTDELSTQEALLNPEEQATFNISEQKLSLKKVNIDQILAWRDGILQFEKIPFSEAAGILERWYNVKILFGNEALKNCIIRGKYKNENLVNVLESFRFLQGIEYRFGEDNKVFISGNGCQTKK